MPSASRHLQRLALIFFATSLWGCASAPDIAYLSGRAKVAINSPLTPAHRLQPATNLAHDAPDITRLTLALEQLKTQLEDARAGKPLGSAKRFAMTRPPSPSPLPSASATASSSPPSPGASSPGASPPPSTHLVAMAPEAVFHLPADPELQSFGIDTTDTTLVGVLARWSRQAGWQLRLNGRLVATHRFPRHGVSYADVALTSSASTLKASELEPAVAALVQAHGRYQHQLDFSVAIQAEAREIILTSQPMPAALMPLHLPNPNAADANGTTIAVAVRRHPLIPLNTLLQP
jgi:hypothetical protein